MKKFEELAVKIASVLDDHGSQTDVAIYYDGKRLSNNGEEWNLKKSELGSEYTEWANDDTITMTFEGPLYDAINYGLNEALVIELRELIEASGHYWELGDNWNLALYKHEVI